MAKFPSPPNPRIQEGPQPPSGRGEGGGGPSGDPGLEPPGDHDPEGDSGSPPDSYSAPAYHGLLHRGCAPPGAHHFELPGATCEGIARISQVGTAQEHCPVGRGFEPHSMHSHGSLLGGHPVPTIFPPPLVPLPPPALLVLHPPLPPFPLSPPQPPPCQVSGPRALYSRPSRPPMQATRAGYGCSFPRH